MTPEEGLAAWFAAERGREVKIENLSQSTAARDGATCCSTP